MEEILTYLTFERRGFNEQALSGTLLVRTRSTANLPKFPASPKLELHEHISTYSTTRIMMRTAFAVAAGMLGVAGVSGLKVVTPSEGLTVIAER